MTQSTTAPRRFAPPSPPPARTPVRPRWLHHYASAALPHVRPPALPACARVVAHTVDDGQFTHILTGLPHLNRSHAGTHTTLYLRWLPDSEGNVDTRVRVDRLDNDVMVPPNLRECHFEVYPQHQFAVSKWEELYETQDQ